MLQALKIHHKESEISRTQDLTRKAMQYSYFIYLNYKLFPKGVVPRVIMFWSMFCDLMLTAVKNMIFHPKQRRFQELVYICMAYWIAFRNFRDLQKGDLQKFNIYISQMPLRLK
jgi:hypothetical protein